MNVLVTGSAGFVGKNVLSILSVLGHSISTFDKSNKLSDLQELTKSCDAVIHLAGVNRPTDPKEFYEGNADLTKSLCDALAANGNTCPVVISSSIQAEKDNDYGKSKKQAEDSILDFSKRTGNKVYIFRFKNLYGKWSRPNYNSVVATWCYNISRNLEVTIDSPSIEIELCYIDDVIEAIVSKLDGNDESGFYEVERTDKITLGELHDTLVSYRDARNDFSYPDQSTDFKKNLYATYLHYLPTDKYSYLLKTNSDDRGSFTEILKSKTEGQVSVNISKPGVIKGQHWHSTKNEKFLVVAGEGLIQLRDIFSDEIIEYPVSGDKLEVVDIPTGYTHNLINRGDTDMITIIWANELFDKEKPDTNYLNV